MTSKTYFVENKHDLKRTCELSGTTRKYIDFSKNKLFRQRDNTDVSKKMVKKKFE